MKKLAGIIIIVVIAVVIAAPYFTGKFAEIQVNNLVSNLNETQLQNGTTEILTYERSMFSSTSTYRYSLPTHLNQIFGNIGTFEYGELLIMKPIQTLLMITSMGMIQSL